MLCRFASATLVGVDAVPVEVEVESSRGLPGFHLVGLPDGAVREGTVRIRSALASSGFSFGSSRVTINLAPADLRKDGAAFDLPIALGALVSRGLIAHERGDILFAGELALDGRIRPIRGALPLALCARQCGLAAIALPTENAEEAAVVAGISVYGIKTLADAVALLKSECAMRSLKAAQFSPVAASSGDDFSDLRGQPEARRAAEIAAAGGHNLMLIGPPGAGKTMVARRIPGIMPQMSPEEAIETTKIHSVAGTLGERNLMHERPFRAPHHTCSGAGLIGGGSTPRPGEVSLAHNGVLFLDELPEFQRHALEALREPLESGDVTIVRARLALTFPARFMLVAAMNPCPCGYRGSTVRACTCGEKSARRYSGRISGPLLDRFDLFVQAQPLPAEALLDTSPQDEASSVISQRVQKARAIQKRRFIGLPLRSNADIPTRQLWHFCRIDASSRRLIREYADVQKMSARALHRCCRVSRTLADLNGRRDVGEEEMALALSLQQERWVSA